MAGDTATLLIWGGLLGGVAGYVMHRADFCMAGAVRDLLLFRSTALLRPWLLLVFATMAVVVLARIAGVLPSTAYPLFGRPGVSNLLGGALFGVGMVLAGGCVVGVLYKCGGGSGSAALAIIGLLLGSALYAEVHPWWREVVRWGAFPGEAITLSQLLGADDRWLLAGCAVSGLGWLGGWQRRRTMVIAAHAGGYLQPWRAALVLAAIGCASLLTIGMPLGITTAYAKIAAFGEALVVPGHVAAVDYFRALPLQSRTPVGRVVLSGGAGPVFDGIAVVQFPLIFGIVAGAAVSAWRLGNWRWNWRLPRRQALGALGGGLLMGLASRFTPGCNIWHLWGGLPVLALQSILFAVGLVPGTWLGIRLLTTLVIPPPACRIPRCQGEEP